MRLLPALILLLLLAPVQAQDQAAPIPRPRPPIEQQAAPAAEKPQNQPETVSTPPRVPPAAAPSEPPLAPLPRPRPDPEAKSPAADKPADASPPAASAQPDAAAAEGAAPSEPAKPPRVYQTACPAALAGQVEAKAMPPISEGQCGLQSPLSVTGVLVNGRMVPFTSAATLSCGMATALPQWVSAVDGYLQAHDNTAVKSVIIGTSYMCRNVNNAAAGNLSDHALADAVDVVGFKLDDGRSITVGEGWTGTEEQGSRIVRYAHDAACSLFMTTLGPEANALHHDHLHLDLLCHGKNCTARLCQ